MNVTRIQIFASATAAQNACNASIEETQELVDNYESIAASSSCFYDLWYNDSHLLVESTWMKACANIELLYPIQFQSKQSTVTTCMLQHTLEVSPTVFGFEQPSKGSPESCFPPRYKVAVSICHTIIVPTNCLDEAQQVDLAMSMDYSKPSTNHTLYIVEFCNVLEELSSNVGRGCLLDVCDVDSLTSAPHDMSHHEGTPSLSISPSSPSLVPSDAPAPTSPPTDMEQNTTAPFAVAAPVTPSPTTSLDPILPGPRSLSPVQTNVSASLVAGTDFPAVELDMFDWDLERTGPVTVIFADEEEEMRLSYNISLHTAVVRIFAADCLDPVALHVIAVSLESNATSSTHGRLDVELDVNQTASSIVGSSIWRDSKTTKEGFIDLCVRVDLILDNDEQTSVNFHEQQLYLTIGLSQGFNFSQPD